MTKHTIPVVLLEFMNGGRHLWIHDAMGGTVIRVRFWKKHIYLAPHFKEEDGNSIGIEADASFCMGLGYDGGYIRPAADFLKNLDGVFEGEYVNVRVDEVCFEEGGNEIVVVRDSKPVLRLQLTGILHTEMCQTNPCSHIDLDANESFYFRLPFNFS